MNESDLSSATHSSAEDMIEIVIDDSKKNSIDRPMDETTKDQMHTSNCENKKSCFASCFENITNFYCGKSLSYFSCVCIYGCFPGIIIMLCFALISGLVWGIVGGNTGMIVGIVFLCLSICIPILLINLAALYAYFYPSNNIGSLGYCCFCCK